jgi:anthranilate synthase/aminodeoxychorismate synthase-like glutamine amidotransferase
MRVLVIDHEDSFVHNLSQALGTLGAEVHTRRSSLPFSQVVRLDPDAVVLSPGPGHPSDRATLGVTYRILSELSPTLPTLGVCLGHQAIGHHFGARVVRAPHPCHGETSRVSHGPDPLYRGLPDPLTAARYHSLVVSPSRLPSDLQVTAWEGEGRSRVIMGLRHRRYPVVSVQFHPESYLTPGGPRLLQNFLSEARR